MTDLAHVPELTPTPIVGRRLVQAEQSPDIHVAQLDVRMRRAVLGQVLGGVVLTEGLEAGSGSEGLPTNQQPPEK